MRSLLNLENTKYGSVVNSIHDLQIDSIARMVFSDTSKMNKIISILDNILLDKETIEYRQSILKDFLYNRTIYVTLMKECVNLEKCYSDYDANRSYRSKLKLKSDISIADISTSLRDYGYTFRKLIEIYLRIDAMFKDNTPSSKGLKSYAANVKKRVTSEGILELLELIEQIITSGQAYSYTITLDDYLVPIKEKYIICNGKYEGEKFTLFKKKNNANKVVLNDKIIDDSKRIMNDSYNRSVSIIEQLFEALFDEIGFITKEMVFFEFGIKLYDIFGERKEDICFPEVSDGKISITNSKDPYLITRYFTEGYGDKIYGNDINLSSSNSCLVIGSNNTGKTVFLRTIGIFQIFTQSGLFLSCDKAYLPIKNQVVSIFSGEEKDTNVGGRFEKEAIDIKEVIDKVDENSLVIINEIFQSTFALDGMNALVDVLSYFTDINVKWITVTHLISRNTNLGNLEETVKMYETTGKDNRYKILEVNK